MIVSKEIGGAELAEYLLREKARGSIIRQLESGTMGGSAGFDAADARASEDMLAERLTRQVPAFVYFNDAGKVMQGLPYGGAFPNQLYVELLTPRGEDWQQGGLAEHFTGFGNGGQAAARDELGALRQMHGMTHDLLGNPDAVYEGALNPNTPIYLHVGNVDQRPAVGLFYLLPPLLPPRMMGFLNARNLSGFSLDNAPRLESPPTKMLQHARAMK